MCRIRAYRNVLEQRIQFVVLSWLFYFVLYLLISYLILPETQVTFVSDAMRVGDKYSLIFLAAPSSPVYTDTEGAHVFRSRHCGYCFVTNNKGFIPMNLYDAVLIFQEASWQETAFVEPDKRYKIETSMNCVRNKLSSCAQEPKIVSLDTGEKFNLCSFCDHLRKNK